MGNTCCGKKKKLSKIVLLLVGLDNAGKTVAARNLSGDSVEEAIAPTVGFSLIKLKYSKYVVHIFDLGGGSNIRSIWDKYFVDKTDYTCNYGHKTSKFTNKTTCGNCAENHTTKDCQENLCCTNCKYFNNKYTKTLAANHKANSPQCPYQTNQTHCRTN